MRQARWKFNITACILLTVSALSGFAEEPVPIKLPAPRTDSGIPLMEALSKRKTTRSFSEKELPPQVLSDLLWAAFGINRKDSGKRTAPSAVNWQEIDIYVAREDGLFLYDAVSHSLKPVLSEDIREITGLQDFTQQAPVNLIYVADFSRMMGADPEKKVFYSAADTGFISQNVYLFCASGGLATVVLGMVDKPALEKKMGLRNDQKVILTQPVGYPE